MNLYFLLLDCNLSNGAFCAVFVTTCFWDSRLISAQVCRVSSSSTALVEALVLASLLY